MAERVLMKGNEAPAEAAPEQLTTEEAEARVRRRRPNYHRRRRPRQGGEGGNTGA